MGRVYRLERLTQLGKRIYVGLDAQGNERRNLVDIFMVKDNSPLETYVLQKSEVYAICACPIPDLKKAHTIEGYSFTTLGMTNAGERIRIQVDVNSFPYNWDNYHFKMVLLAERF